MSFIGVEWGMESIRAWRFDARGQVIDRRLGRTGLVKAARRGHEETLFRCIGGWLDPDTLVALSSARADRHAWLDAPLLDGSVGLRHLLDGGIRRPLREATLLVLPGLARRAPGADDLMHREALLALGAIGSGDGRPDGNGEPRLLVVPGSRSRWIRTSGGRIDTFRTTMGGELLGLLLEGPFEPLMQPGSTLDDPVFLEGVEQGYRSRHIVTDLFAARAAAILDERAPGAARPHLTGLLIGNEIREMEAALGATGEALTLLGTDQRCDPHARALRHLGTTVAREDDELATIAGFVALQAALPADRLARPLPSSEAGVAHRASATLLTATATATTTTGHEHEHEHERRGWDDAFAELSLVAPMPQADETRSVALAESLIEAGFRIVVVSARAPGAIGLVERLSETVGERICIGVHETDTPKHAAEAIAAGARVVLASGADPDIARRCRKRGATWVPGAATVTEASTALGLGARALVLYPAVQIEPRVLHALARALPPGTPLLPAGGLSARALLPYAAAGAAGAIVDERSLGTEADLDEIGASARDFVAAWRRIERGRRALAAREQDAPATDGECSPLVTGLPPRRRR